MTTTKRIILIDQCQRALKEAMRLAGVLEIPHGRLVAFNAVLNKKLAKAQVDDLRTVGT